MLLLWTKLIGTICCRKKHSSGTRYFPTVANCNTGTSSWLHQTLDICWHISGYTGSRTGWQGGQNRMLMRRGGEQIGTGIGAGLAAMVSAETPFPALIP